MNEELRGLIAGGKQILNRFAQIDITDEEYLRGSVYNQEQLWVLQNMLAEAALLKSTEDLNPEHPLPYIQQESYNKGKIELIEFMLTNHEASTDELTNRLRDRQSKEE